MTEPIAEPVIQNFFKLVADSINWVDIQSARAAVVNGYPTLVATFPVDADATDAAELRITVTSRVNHIDAVFSVATKDGIEHRLLLSSPRDLTTRRDESADYNFWPSEEEQE